MKRLSAFLILLLLLSACRTQREGACSVEGIPVDEKGNIVLHHVFGDSATCDPYGNVYVGEEFVGVLWASGEGEWAATINNGGEAPFTAETAKELTK